MCGPAFVSLPTPEKRLMTRQKGSCARFQDVKTASIFRHFEGYRRANVYSDNMLDEHVFIQLSFRQVKFLDDEVVPVRASARDYNPVNKIGGNQFTGGRTQYGNVRWWPRNIHQSYESHSSAQVTETILRKDLVPFCPGPGRWFSDQLPLPAASKVVPTFDAPLCDSFVHFIDIDIVFDELCY